MSVVDELSELEGCFENRRVALVVNAGCRFKTRKVLFGEV